MAHLIIKNVGPIKNVKLNLNRINVFMGPQSSGKSTIAKIICHCQWVEKQCFSNFLSQSKFFINDNKFYTSLKEYHRLDGYFNEKSRIEYKGDYIKLEYEHRSKTVTIKRQNQQKLYLYPKIAYIPSERNIVAAVPNLKKYNDTNDVILYFMYDWFTARESILEMSLKDVLSKEIKYNYNKDKDYILDNNEKILLTNASSGLQSLTPLMLVLQYILDKLYLNDRPLSYEQVQFRNEIKQDIESVRSSLANHINDTVNIDKLYEKVMGIVTISKEQLKDNLDSLRSLLESLFKYRYSEIFLEEPEQNLFPNTQEMFVYWLLELIKCGDRKNVLTLTTHSPYILFSLNNCMMGGLVNKNVPFQKQKEFLSHNAWIDPKKVSIYEIHDGTIKCMQDEDGILEDNYLNKAYKENTKEYLSLLNYYDDEE